MVLDTSALLALLLDEPEAEAYRVALEDDETRLDAGHVAEARRAYRRFGRGHHAARLDFGDVFAYALARASGEALLFKGEDFSKTDVRPAI